MLLQNKCQFSVCIDEGSMSCHRWNDETKLEQRKNMTNIIPFLVEHGLPIIEIELCVWMISCFLLNDVILTLFKNAQHDNIYVNLWENIQFLKLRRFNRSSNKIDDDNSFLFQLIQVLSEIKLSNISCLF